MPQANRTHGLSPSAPTGLLELKREEEADGKSSAPHMVHLGGSPFTSCLGDLRHVTPPRLASVFSSVNRVNSTYLSGVVVRIKCTLCIKFPDQCLVLSSCSIHLPSHGYNNENDFFKLQNKKAVLGEQYQRP